MKLPESVQVAPFPPCGDGLKTLKTIHSGELIMSGKFDVCALNDGKALEENCSHCLNRSSRLACSTCEMVHYCSEKCQKEDAKLHELECSLGEKLKQVSKIPTRSQRLLLRFLKSGLIDISKVNFSIENKKISEYLMVSAAIIKKYLHNINFEHHELFIMSCQLRYSCFEIDEIGIGYSDALKKINHSCDPNVIAEFSQNSVNLFALKDILPGNQLKISYVYDPKNNPNVLKEFYDFKCLCEVCNKK